MSDSQLSPPLPQSAPPLTDSAVAALIRLPNQSGTWLLLLPCLWALVLASDGKPRLSLLLIFTAGAFLMRSAGVVFNDMADRDIDQQVARTRSRPLASGRLSMMAALVTAGILVLLAAGLLTLLNTYTLLLSPIALLLAAIYPLAKRFLHIPQAILGIAFGWGIIMAWAAVRNAVDTPAWVLYMATICWTVAYDTIYALQDREDDARIGVRSAAIFFGSRTWLAVGIALGGMIVLLGLVGWLMDLGVVFYGMLAAVGGFFSQQVLRLRGDVSPGLAFTMFRQHIWAGAAILAGIWAGTF